MFSIKSRWVLGALLFFAVAGVQAQQKPMTLEECVTYALSNNINVQNAQLETLASKATVGETRAQGLPQISATIDFTRNLLIPRVFLPANIFDPSAPEGETAAAKFGVDYQGNMVVSVSQLIFDGSYFVGLRAAATYRELADWDKVRTEIETIETVRKAYYSVLVNEERLELLNKNVSRLDTLLKETKAMYANGFAEKIDVSRIQVQYNNIKVERDNVAELQGISIQLLKLQMGMPLVEEIQLVGSLSDFIGEIDYAIDATAEVNYNDRVEYKLNATNLELADLDLKNNQVQYMPKLNAFGNWGRNTGTDDFSRLWQNDSWFSNSAVGLSLNIPIFDGLAKSYRVQKNRIQINQLENQRRFLEDNIQLEIRQARQSLKNSLAKLEAQKENRDLANEVFRVTKAKYQQGVGSNFELVEAETSLKEAETNYFAAIYDALIAQVELEKALGTLNQ
ncbi:TolC family protein [Penaeicola halotolerans]|uniref:TolC family protein n=1 Tax=Penaeicola halotolerans TaxID=2793196 RepID=UPI001CF81830|nr:TolC family protein [Penaeicola halotolerans]